MNNKKHLYLIAAAFLQIAIAAPHSAFALTPVIDHDILRVDISHMSGFYGASIEKVNQAADVVEQVLNSTEFQQAVYNHTYNGQKTFANNDNETNPQIYERILKGHETYSSTDDHVAQLDLDLYTPAWYKKWTVVGYGIAGQPEIYMNSYYFNSFSVAEVAGNIAHEWMHKIGFDHDYKRTAQRPYSVPYAVGDIVIQLAKTAQ